MEKIDFLDFFDPENDEHMRAYKELIETGMWPEGFIDYNKIDMNVNWQLELTAVFANLYLKKRMKKINRR